MRSTNPKDPGSRDVNQPGKQGGQKQGGPQQPGRQGGQGGEGGRQDQGGSRQGGQSLEE